MEKVLCQVLGVAKDENDPCLKEFSPVREIKDKHTPLPKLQGESGE